MGKMLVGIKRVFLAGIMAFVVINLFCLFFYNLPARTSNSGMSTDYKWNSGSFYCRYTEGFGYGFINDDGFNNVNNLSEIDSIDVLMLGSSHLEGFNVPQYKILSEVFNNISELTAYNIGISGHNLTTCFDNLESALSTYKPEKYVVFETMTLSFYSDQLDDYLNSSRKREMAMDSGIVGLAQKIPFFRLMAFQLNNLKNSKNTEDSVGTSTQQITNQDLLNVTLNKVKKTCDIHEVQPIIFYHPILTINDGKIVDLTIENDRSAFAEECEKNGIVFVDMTDTFFENYFLNNELPHGFNNTVPGTGHLNETGHRLIAEKLNETLNSLGEAHES